VRVAGSRERTVAGRGSLQNVFWDCIWFGARIIHEEVSMVMYFLYYYGSRQTNEGVHREKSAGVGSVER